MESVSSPNVDISKFLPPDQSNATKSLFRSYYPGFGLKMLEEGVHADVTLTANGGSVKAHRIVLSCVSPVFSAMFQHDMKEQATACVDIPDMTIDALQLFLLVIYTVNEVDKRVSPNGMHRRLSAAIDKHFVEFFNAVLKYQMEGCLKNVLELALVRNLSPENCLYYYTRARLPGRPLRSGDLAYLCFCYIMCNYRDVIRCTETQVAMKRDTALVHHLLIDADTPAKRNMAIQWFEERRPFWKLWTNSME